MYVYIYVNKRKDALNARPAAVRSTQRAETHKARSTRQTENEIFLPYPAASEVIEAMADNLNNR